MTRALMTFCLSMLALAAGACTRVPELEDRLTEDLRAADYPELIPLGANVAALPAPQEQSAALEAELKARSSRLKARARELQAAEG